MMAVVVKMIILFVACVAVISLLLKNNLPCMKGGAHDWNEELHGKYWFRTCTKCQCTEKSLV